MRTKQTPLFIVLSMMCLSVAFIVLWKLSPMIMPQERGAFWVLLAVFLSFITLAAYLLFHAFGQKMILFQTIFEHSNDAISLCDSEGRYLWQNKSHEVLFGFELETLKATPASFFINSKEVLLKEELDRIKEFSGIFKSPSHNGFKDVFISAYRVENELGDTLCYVQMKREAKEYLRIIEKSQRERERIMALAQKDSLTQLLNRNAFFERVEQYRLEGKKGAIIFADIDNFKRINDTYGHDRGDKVLIAVSHLIQKSVRLCDCVARFGGEEFVLWIDASIQDALFVAEKVRLELERTPIEALNVTCSFGISSLEYHDLDVAIKKADEAMYVAKRSGKNRVEQAR